ncbi:hypothetical protein QRX50_06730 [Amycolatopsis carbonis]|uniref:Uncharacterized protein n=1 Tax=Amycolatopsis carbonis TaxID=715471 RepID=A0A9Y2IHI9_9PSEU|nr:hypothetical protein [Amycolatopsis sp. 2-15]WIX80465.1 hypothetical protein QRX50_06730 [Amycolatopsis sp. 2-15]
MNLEAEEQRLVADVAAVLRRTDGVVDAIDDVFRDRLASGLTRDWIEGVVARVAVSLEEAGRTADAELVAEALDDLVGWGPPGSAIRHDPDDRVGD